MTGTRVAEAGSDPTDLLSEAVSEIVDGQTVAIGGYFQHRHPMAVVRELVRQGKRDLHLVTPLGGIDLEVALTGKVARKVTFAFVTLDVFGVAPMFRRATESGEISVVEYGDVTIARALEARARAQRWYPAKTWIGSDMGQFHPGEQFTADDGAQMFRAPAMEIDWVAIHAPFATARGDVALAGESFDGFLIRAGDRAIITTDKIISDRELVERWNGRVMLRPHSDYVIELPHAAHPTSCYPHYVQDVDYICSYADAMASGGSFDVCGVSEKDYLSSLPADRLTELDHRMAVATQVADVYR
jgi:glutaconate CoA-transferase, subunit A